MAALSVRPTAREALAAELSTWLVDRNLVDERGLDRARRVAQESAHRFEAALLQLGLISERALLEAYAELRSLPIVGARDLPEEPLLPDRLKGKFLRKVRALPVRQDAAGLWLAVVDPADDFTPAAVAAATDQPVCLCLALPIELDAALDRLYPASEPGLGDTITTGSNDSAPDEDDAERLRDLASEAPVIRLVNQLIFRAVETRASDIHIEPTGGDLRVRFRYDGVLHEIETPPQRLQAAIISRLKIMARLDIAERRLPQDGRIELVVRGQEIDLRVSTVPALHGETVVLRILDRSAVELDFGKLGLGPDVRQALGQVLALPNGIILVTGPTGSGKTTTLYTALQSLDARQRKVVTVEDPIEYQLPLINQIQVKPQIGLTFARLLRAILRQDPDIIMIGEIRDLETAQIAVQAALTGHLVLSTLHTNSAAASVTRLRDMGVDDYLLSATLNAVMGQRLVRCLCPACRRAVDAPPELRQRFGLDRLQATSGPVRLYEPGGCAACRGTGFGGRRAVAEIITSSEAVQRLILSGGDQAAIHAAAAAGGMRSMFENGLDLVLAGTTTLAELTRSVRAEE